MEKGMGNKTNAKENGKDRMQIAQMVLASSIIGAVGLAIMVIIMSMYLRQKQIETAYYVFGSIIPLLGTWVGTILAYYFSEKNFQSASRSVQEMARQLTPTERLMSIPAKAKMTPKSEITLLNITSSKPLDKIMLIDDLVKTFKDQSRNRLPILDENDHPKYIIHRSMIDKYLSKKAIEDKLPVDQLEALSLQDLLNEDAELKQMFETSFVTIKEDATLADAKFEMESVRDCLDVFVTNTGTKNEPIIGWLTNIKIAESAKA